MHIVWAYSAHTDTCTTYTVKFGCSHYFYWLPSVVAVSFPLTVKCCYLPLWARSTVPVLKSINIMSVLKSRNAFNFRKCSALPETFFCAAVFYSNCFFLLAASFHFWFCNKKCNGVKRCYRFPPQQHLLKCVNSILFAQSSHTSGWLKQVVTMLRRLKLASDTTECSAYQALTQKLCSDCISSFCVLIAKRGCTSQTGSTNGNWRCVCVCAYAGVDIIYVFIHCSTR